MILRPEQEEVADRPEVAGVDLAAGATGPPADLLGRHGGVDLPHHLGVAQEGLRAGHHDVGRHRDQRALERGALLGERLGDGRVVGDEPVGRSPRDGLLSHGRPPRRPSSRARPRRRRRARRPAKAQPITHGTWNSRLTMPMWLRTVPLVQMIAGQLVVDRRQERGAGVAHEGDDAVGPAVHQGQHVVGALHRREATAHRRVVEHLRPPPDLSHGPNVVSRGGGCRRAGAGADPGAPAL